MVVAYTNTTYEFVQQAGTRQHKNTKQKLIP
jgi:hypothetical protein